jgi:hypothetical protein
MNDNLPRSGDPASTGSDVRDTVRHKAADLAHDAKEQAREQYDRQKGVALGELDSLASALRRAGNELGDEHGMSSRVVTTVADRIQTFSRSLDGKDLDRVVRDVELFARRNPAAFLGGAVALGFLASRFLKSGSSSFGNRSDLYSHEAYGGYYRGRSESAIGSTGLGAGSTSYGIEHATDSGTGMRGAGLGDGSSATGMPSTSPTGSATGVSGTIGSSGSATPGTIGTASDTTPDSRKGRR